MKRKIKPLRLLLLLFIVYEIIAIPLYIYEISTNPDKAANYIEMMKHDNFKD